MGLINIPEIQTDDEATEELFNSRFGVIADTLNGNIDADNLEDGAVTTPKLANGSVTNSKLDDNTIDAAKMENPVAFRGSRASTQAITGSTWTKVQLSTEDYDYGANYDNATNYRFVAPVTGVYSFSGAATFNASPERVLLAFYKNGTEYYKSSDLAITAGDNAFLRNTVATDMLLTAADYIELFVWVDDTANLNPASMTGHLVGQVQ